MRVLALLILLLTLQMMGNEILPLEREVGKIVESCYRPDLDESGWFSCLSRRLPPNMEIKEENIRTWDLDKDGIAETAFLFECEDCLSGEYESFDRILAVYDPNSVGFRIITPCYCWFISIINGEIATFTPIGNRGEAIAFYRWNGEGEAEEECGFGGYGCFITFEDLNGDGYNDVIETCRERHSVFDEDVCAGPYLLVRTVAIWKDGGWILHKEEKVEDEIRAMDSFFMGLQEEDPEFLVSHLCSPIFEMDSDEIAEDILSHQYVFYSVDSYLNYPECSLSDKEGTCYIDTYGSGVYIFRLKRTKEKWVITLIELIYRKSGRPLFILGAFDGKRCSTWWNPALETVKEFLNLVKKGKTEEAIAMIDGDREHLNELSKNLKPELEKLASESLNIADLRLLGREYWEIELEDPEGFSSIFRVCVKDGKSRITGMLVPVMKGNLFGTIWFDYGCP